MPVTSNPNPQPVELSAWETVSLTVTMARNGSIAGQTFQLNIRDEARAVVLTLNSVSDPSQFTLVDAGSSSTPGVFKFTLTSADTGSILFQDQDYKYDIWRVDSGSEKRLCWGPLSDLEEQWKN